MRTYRADPIARVRGIISWAFWLTVVAIVGLLLLIWWEPQPATETPQAAQHVAGALDTLWGAVEPSESVTAPPAWVTAGQRPCNDGERRRYEQFGVGLWRSWCEGGE